jgi:hypothetical protein
MRMTYRKRSLLPSKAFAVPSLRKLPINDASHTRNAAARLGQTTLAPKFRAEAKRNIQKMRKVFHIKGMPL